MYIRWTPLESFNFFGGKVNENGEVFIFNAWTFLEPFENVWLEIIVQGSEVGWCLFFGE